MAKQTFQVGIEFIANISQLQGQVKQVTGEIERMGSTSSGAQLQTQFNNLTKSLADLQTRAQQPITSAAEFSRLESDLNKVEQGYLSLLQTIERMKGAADTRKLELLPADQQSRIKQAEAALKQYENATKSASSGSKDFLRAQEQIAKQGGVKSAATAEMRKYKKALDEAEQEVKQLTEQQKQLNTELEGVKTSRDSLQGQVTAAKKRGDTEGAKQLTVQLEAAKSRVTELRGQLKGVDSSLQSAKDRAASFTSQWSGAKAKIKEAETLIEQANTTMSQLGSGNTQQLQQAFEQLKTKARELGVSLEGIDDVSSIEVLKERLQQLKTQGLEQVDAGLDKTAANLRANFGSSLSQTKSNLQQLRMEFDRFNNRLQELNQFKSYITYFFSLTNSVYLFRAALQSAFETVKELDAAMTETAVVTDFSIGDMWDKLPEYTKNASKLGATTKDLYKATTLYYQQGLKGKAVMDVGIETMKMARIASMEAAEATEAMTAALRGFNMEVNQINAERVNDVYSQLAAITAADTEQIATAMTKTASIAHSANMEFETTAALLAQIIETTQEAPETAGTAMKTIIARFSEVKELQNRGEKTGKDEEGEEIDVNKIDRALKTVGISMDEFFAGTKGLDEVLLELAEKWDSLDFETQRYIATMAAGSRQQSRFIAMMSDYSRTMDLVDAANNSAGASQRQFEKTLDSLEAKMNKLRNAWDEFTMGLANNEFIKLAVDALSGLVTGVNWLIDKLSDLFGLMDGEADTVNNLVKSILTLGAAIAAIAGARALLNFGFGKIIDGVENKRAQAQQKIKEQQIKRGEIDPDEDASRGATNLETSATNAGRTLETSATAAGEAFRKAVMGASVDERTELEKLQADQKAEQEKLQADHRAAQEQLQLDQKAEQEKLQADQLAAQEQLKFIQQATLEEMQIDDKAFLEEVQAKMRAALEQLQADQKAEQEKLQADQKTAQEKLQADQKLEQEKLQSDQKLEQEKLQLDQKAHQETMQLDDAIHRKTMNSSPTGGQTPNTGGNTPATPTKTPSAKQGSTVVGGSGGGIKGWWQSNKSMIAWTAAIVVSIAAISKTVDYFNKAVDKANYTTQEQLADIASAREAVEKALAETTSKVDNYDDLRKNLEDAVNSLDDLRRGSAKWASTMHEVRMELNNILTEFPQLRDELEIVNGVSMLSDEGWALYENLLVQRMHEQESLATSLAIQSQEVSSRQAAEGLNIKTSSITQSEQQNITTGQTAGGWIGGVGAGLAGAALGVKIGGSVGSIAGPIGLAVGAIIGALAGILIGGAIGGAGATQGVDPETVNKVALAASEYTVERDGENVTFSAHEAILGENGEEEIRKFLIESGLEEGSSDFNQLFEYIMDNAKEFDEHSSKMAQDKAALEAHIQALGESTAAAKGMKGGAAETYANIIAGLADDGEYRAEVDRQRVILAEEYGITADASANEFKQAWLDNGLYQEYADIMGITLNTNDTKNLFGDGTDLPTYAEMVEVIASARANGSFEERADYYFKNIRTSDGLTSADKARFINGSSTAKDFTLEDIKAITNFQNIDETTLNKLKLHEALGTGTLESYINTAGSKDAGDLYKNGFSGHAKMKDGSVDKSYLDGIGQFYLSSQLLMDAPTRALSTEQAKVHEQFDPYRKDMNEFLFDRYLKEQGLRAWEQGDKRTDEQHTQVNFRGNDVAIGIELADELFEAGKNGWSYEEFVKNTGEEMYINTSAEGFSDAFEYSKSINDVGIDWASLEKNSSLFYERLGEVGNGFQQEVETSQQQYGWNEASLEGLKFLEGQTFGVIDAYFGKLNTYENLNYNAVGRTDQQAFDFIKDSFNTLANGLAESEQTGLLNVLMSSDWHDGGDLENLRHMAEEVYDLSEIDSANLDAFIDACYETNLAIQNVDINALKTQIEATAGLISKIDKLDLGDTLTLSGEELQSAIKAAQELGLNLKDSFIRTDEGYTYLGDSMNDLRMVLAESNRIALANQHLALATSIKQGQFIEKSGAGEGSNINWGNAAGWHSGDIKEMFSALYGVNVEDHKNEDGSINTSSLESALAKGGAGSIEDPFSTLGTGGIAAILTDSFNWEDDYLSSYVHDLINNAAISYLDLDTNSSQGKETMNEMQQLVLTQSSGQEILQAEGTAMEGQPDIVYDEANVDKALDYKVGQVEGGRTTAERWSAEVRGESQDIKLNMNPKNNGIVRSVKDFEMSEKAAERLAKSLVADYDKAQKAQDKLNSSVSDNADAFKNAKKGSDSYLKALDKITDAAKEVFGDEITSKFVEENKDLFLDLAAGGETAQAAYEELGMRAAAEFLGMKRDGEEFANVINAAMGGIPKDLEIGASFDATQAINDLMNLGYTAEEAAKILDKMGYKVTYTTETHYIGSVSGQDYGTKRPAATVDHEQVHAVETVVATGVRESAKGTGFNPSGGGGGGGSSNKWENPYDEFYNTVEKINEELRKREKLELRYQRLLDRNAATAAEIAKLTREQLASLEIERTDREGLLQGRRRQMNDIMSEYSDVGKYAKYNEETGQIEINWDLLEALDGSTNEELTSRIEEFISKLEEQQDLIEEEEDAIEEIKDAVWEIYEQGKDEYFDLEEQIKEAIVADRQREIDKLSEINESINDTNSRLLDSMQQQLDEYRQNRDNQKTEEEISDKQRRLAYLQQDTSGANALEIMQLQEEIDEAQEDYTDTLIDQKISELQQQNDEAAEQRQRQIDIMQSQLDWYQESSAIWEEVSALIEEGLDENNGLIRGSQLETLLKEEAGFEGLSKLGKMNWLNELNGNIAQALAWLKGGAVQTLFGQGGEVNFTNADGNLVTGTVNSDGDIETSDGQIYSAESFSIDSQGNVTSTETQAQAQENYQTTHGTGGEEQQVAWNYSWPKPSTGSGVLQWGSRGDRVRGLQQALKDMGYSSVGSVDGQFGQKTYNAVKQFQKDAKAWQPNIGYPDGKVGPQTREAFRLKQYKTGGLADFTGPAWLDGTKTKPEYILNADQTKAFFQLVDVLSSLQTKSAQTTQNNGDNTFDIDINVESIGNDYDVEQLAETVKRLINDDARYRNNNAINLMR